MPAGAARAVSVCSARVCARPSSSGQGTRTRALAPSISARPIHDDSPAHLAWIREQTKRQ